MNSKKITGHTKAWVSSRYGFDRMEQEIAAGRNDNAVNQLSFTNSDMSDCYGWVEVGVATVTVEFFPSDQIVAKQVEELREQLRQHRIRAHEAEQAILAQISKLQAIEVAA